MALATLSGALVAGTGLAGTAGVASAAASPRVADVITPSSQVRLTPQTAATIGDCDERSPSSARRGATDYPDLIICGHGRCCCICAIMEPGSDRCQRSELGSGHPKSAEEI
jgi:hypothetical protein